MTSERILLTNKQIEILANELLKELDRAGLFDRHERRWLISECIKKTQRMIAVNIRTIFNNNPDYVVKELFVDIGCDYFETPEQRFRPRT